MTAIEQIQAAIAERRQQLTGLEYALAILTAPSGTIAVPVAEPRIAEPAAKKPNPPVAPQRPEASEPRTQADSHGYAKDQQIRRHRMARLLDEHGPMQFGQIAGLVRCAPATLRKDLDESGLFEKSDPTSTRPLWRLTESGRKLAASNEPG